MRRRNRNVRILKWLGTVVCALLIAAFAISLFWRVRYTRVAKPPHVELVLIEGKLTLVQNYFDDATIAAARKFGIRSDCWVAESHKVSEPWALLWPDAFFRSHQTYNAIVIPLWMPFVAALIPTLVLWRLDRRNRWPPGHCRCCGYSLTGLTSGRCPECGTAVRGVAQPGRHGE